MWYIGQEEYLKKTSGYGKEKPTDPNLLGPFEGSGTLSSC